MQFNVNVDCTPEEARTFLGLPDLKPIQDRYVNAVLDTMKGATSIEQMESMFRSLSPIGDASIKMFTDMMNIGLAAAGGKKE
ncbi:MAG TPA: DUF6489 family protein [Sphingobium sp.]|nr:DUF6489 family protein [Sphingobium sp.]